jgi:hypothetical protein
MTRKVLFIQGGGEGAHDCDSRLATSLREKLGTGFEVRYPKMPNESDPSYSAWQRCIREELASLGGGVALVGHSLGASVLIKLLAEGPTLQPVAGIFLIAAPFFRKHEGWQWEEAELPDEAEAKMPTGVPLFLYHGRDDEVVPFGHLSLYAKTFPRSHSRALAGRDHQLNDDLTEVADDVARVCQ